MGFGELHLQPWPDVLPFKVWYVPAYPIEAIDYDRTPRPERAAIREQLAENIKAQGLINPLIVLNHPRPKCKPNWLMVGQNRLAAIKLLGWTHAPCVVTGEKPPYEAREVTPAEVPSLFPDGRPFVSAYGIGLTATTPPETFTYPNLAPGIEPTCLTPPKP